MTVPGVWSEGRWLVEPETGRRLLVVAELEPGEHAPVQPAPASRPPLLAWALICGSGTLVAIAAVVALLVVGFDSPATAALNWAVIVGGLATMMLCAVAAARLQDAYRRPLELAYRPKVRTAPQRAAVGPVRHLRAVEAGRASAGRGGAVGLSPVGAARGFSASTSTAWPRPSTPCDRSRDRDADGVRANRATEPPLPGGGSISITTDSPILLNEEYLGDEDVGAAGGGAHGANHGLYRDRSLGQRYTRERGGVYQSAVGKRARSCAIADNHTVPNMSISKFRSAATHVSKV